MLWHFGDAATLRAVSSISVQPIGKHSADMAARIAFHQPNWVPSVLPVAQVLKHQKAADNLASLEPGRSRWSREANFWAWRVHGKPVCGVGVRLVYGSLCSSA